MNVKVLALTLSLVGVSTALMAAPDSSAGADIDARVAETREATGEFIKQLGGTMKQQMQSGGPVAALKVCRDDAPRIANETSVQKGWKVTRVGTRVRNPMLGLPDAWEQTVLSSFEERAAKGEKLKDMEYFEVVEETAGNALRYMKAIGTEPQCLACHGAGEQIAGPVRAEIKRLYPHDRALNYKAGDLRGAVSIKQPLDD